MCIWKKRYIVLVYCEILDYPFFKASFGIVFLMDPFHLWYLKKKKKKKKKRRPPLKIWSLNLSQKSTFEVLVETSYFIIKLSCNFLEIYKFKLFKTIHFAKWKTKMVIINSTNEEIKRVYTLDMNMK